MSSTSAIPASDDLQARFAAAVQSRDVRFIKVAIRDETLVHDLSIPSRASLLDDLASLQDNDVLTDTDPAYILVKLDDPHTDWLAISYVPDSAKVREKMLYASTRASLLKSLGSTTFSDSLFATHKSDLTADAYAAHRRHIAAPKPLSAREQEIVDIRAAEREAGSAYQGSGARSSPFGAGGVGLNWSEEVETAVRDLASRAEQDSILVIIQIDTKSETLTLTSSTPTVPSALASSLPASEPCYAFFAWPGHDIIFIYSCPSNSPIKYRMLYSSGSSTTFASAKSLLSSGLASRKIETSDPGELTEAYLTAELGLGVKKASLGTDGEEKKPFAKPRGPVRTKR